MAPKYIPLLTLRRVNAISYGKENVQMWLNEEYRHREIILGFLVGPLPKYRGSETKSFSTYWGNFGFGDAKRLIAQKWTTSTGEKNMVPVTLNLSLPPWALKDLQNFEGDWPC